MRDEPKQVPDQLPSPGGPHIHSGGMGGTGGGGQPPRKPNRDKNLPPDKIDDEENQEEEDSDRTETVSDSTSGEGGENCTERWDRIVFKTTPEVGK